MISSKSIVVFVGFATTVATYYLIKVAAIDKEIANKIGANLNNLLSNYQVFYMNVRGFHWNIKGEKFFELHAKFEELYDNLMLLYAIKY